LEVLDVTFAYFTPETALPVATAVSAVLGFGLLVVRAPIRIVGQSVRRAARWVRSKFDRSAR
jgi:hypothetical protein